MIIYCDIKEESFIIKRHPVKDDIYNYNTLIIVVSAEDTGS
jgi:hypothetical protein